MTFNQVTQRTDTRIIQQGNRYAIFLRSTDGDFDAWNDKAEPMRRAALFDQKDIAGHTVAVRSGRELAGEPRQIVRTDPETGEPITFVNVCQWQRRYFFHSIYTAEGRSKEDAEKDYKAQGARNGSTRSKSIAPFFRR